MRWYNLKPTTEAAGVGIVTKQNATKDVPVGGEYMNIKKLHLGKGKPKELHKKARKNSTPNKLFNLGMAESISEVSAKDLSKESEIYVDMDGVLADFFGAWKKLVGKDWREITDLDDALQKIRDKDDFWLNIPITSNANNLLSLIKQLKGKYNILSAPLPNDPNSEPHKREWIKKNLSSFPPSNVIITSNKAVHATQPDGTPNILIDDFGKNIAKWEAAGGVGFKHKDHKFERTVQNLKQYMDQDTKEADMSKSSIKKIHKTADKIKDKPKAKKSIGKWAKERGMDPEGAIYAIATNMRKRKEGKKIDAPGRESANEGNLLANPQRSVLVKRDDAYDWYKIGTHMANIKSMSKDVQKKNKPDIFIQFYGGDKEKNYMMKQLKRIGYQVQPADGYKDTHFDEDIEGSYVLRISLENFADGKKKGRKGLSKRVGIPKGASVTQLRKIAKNSTGERRRMAHWQANMKSGRKKKGK